ncbi:MAG: hypothetical protein N2746_11195, partial [Deltaproteobacteria bacterium]|nr:hypothetical protein [Deltaproteobacteria bacterium]
MKKTSLLVLFFILLVFACSDGEDGSPLQDVLHDVLGDVSLTDITAGSEDYAFIVNAAPDYKSATYSVMKIADRSVSKDKDVIHTDAVAKVFNNIVYVVNRMGADNITVIDPKKNFSIIKQFSVGANTNPQDVAIIDNKMFVTKQLSNYIDIYETTNYSKIGSIDISKYADADGNAEPQDMIIYNGKLYLTVLRLDKKNAFAPTDKSYL